MTSPLTYKGYTAKVTYDPEARVLVGSVVGIRDYIMFEAASIEDVEREFQISVDEYLAHCAETGHEPAKPFTGDLHLHTTPDLHRQIVEAACRENRPVNQWVELVIVRALAANGHAAPSGPPGRTASPAPITPAPANT